MHEFSNQPNLPSNVSNILYVYLCSFCDWDLERMQTLYEHEVATHSEKSEYRDILACIKRILEDRKNPKEVEDAVSEIDKLISEE